MPDNFSPTPILKPFGDQTALKNPIPVVHPGIGGRASYEMGFPSETMIPIAAGGTPPFGQDMNGVLNEITGNIYYVQRYAFHKFDQTIADTTGYPRGACLRPDDDTRPYYAISLVDNNTANFNEDEASRGTSWKVCRIIGDYSENENYEEPTWVVTPGNGFVWQNKRPNGPGTDLGVVRPGENAAVWVRFGASDIAGSVEAVPDTLVLRDNTARSKIQDPIDPMDIVNLRTAERIAGASGKNVAQPTILAPAEGTVMQSLSFEITVSAIELLVGGIAQPMATRWRAIDSDEVTILSSGETAYTTTPTVTVPETALGHTFTVVVQHEDEIEGWSPWSPRHAFKMAAVVAKKVAVTSPYRNAIGVIPNDVTIAVAEGAWTDGSAFAGAQSRVQLFQTTGTVTTAIHDTGWVGYATSFVVPADLLTTSTTYWVRAQHRAGAAPPANPEAVLVTPAYGINDGAAGLFTTIAPTAPNTAGLVHTIPSTIAKQSSTTVKIYGATSVDGGAVTYDIINVGAGVTFSKYTDIQPYENITYSAANIAGTIQNVSMQIVAKSEYGASANPVNVNVVILGQTSWIFTTTQQAPLPVDMIANVYIGGGGGPGNPYGGGGGGGCAFVQNLKINAGVLNSIVIGQGGYIQGATTVAGGTSSFNGYAATGGTLGGVGYGVNGTYNYSGGAGTVAQGPYNNQAQAGGGGAGTGNGGAGYYSSVPMMVVGGASGGIGTGAPGANATVNQASEGYGGAAGVAGGGGGGIMVMNVGSANAVGGRGSVYIQFVRGLINGE